MIVEVTLTIEQRIQLIHLVDENFDILDFGIGPIPEDIDEQDKNTHKWIDDNYPEIPKTADVFVTNKK
jgi:hypothetical protein